MDSEIKIDGLPSIKVKVVSDSKEGIIHLDPVYGKHRNSFNLNFKEENADAKFVCPECNSSLIQQEKFVPNAARRILYSKLKDKGCLRSMFI